MKVHALAFHRPRAQPVIAAAVEGARRAGHQNVGEPPSADVLVIYGAGAPDRTATMRRHLESGRRVVCLDKGYLGCGYIRVAVDALHAKPEHIEATPDDPSRFDRLGIELRNDYKPGGPVIVVGMGPKSREGLGLFDWERRALAAAAQRFPDRRIVYRRKDGRRLPKPDGVQWPVIDGKTPISDLLRGASLVICRHSNVAVDACIAGVPVECEDGAARWLYASWSVQSIERRESFLRRLAWWQWRNEEMENAWKFLGRFV